MGLLNVGDRAPEFELPAHDGSLVRLSALLVDGPVVLFFYPADFTPGCTREACSFRDLHDELLAAGLRVVGISPQEVAVHAEFRARHALPFPLLADPRREVIKAYGAVGPFGLGVRRATFLIGRDGTIHDRVVADLNIGRHAAWAERLAHRAKE